MHRGENALPLCFVLYYRVLRPISSIVTGLFRQLSGLTRPAWHGIASCVSPAKAIASCVLGDLFQVAPPKCSLCSWQAWSKVSSRLLQQIILGILLISEGLPMVHWALLSLFVLSVRFLLTQAYDGNQGTWITAQVRSLAFSDDRSLSP